MSTIRKPLDASRQGDLGDFFPLLTPEMEEEGIRLAREQVSAGQTVDAETVLSWIATWGTPNETPPPF